MKQISLSLTILLLVVSCEFSKKNYIQKELAFYANHDSVLLSGILTLPKTDTKVPAVVLIHGAGPLNRDMEFGPHKVFKDLAAYLTSHGIAVLRYDKRGVGKSGGIFQAFDIENYTNDGLSGIEQLRKIEQIDPQKIGVIGVSQGGLIAPKMAASSDDVSFVIMLAGPGVWGREFFYTSHLEICKVAGIKQEEIEVMTVLFNQFWEIISKKALSHGEEQNGKDLLRSLWDYMDDESRQDFGYLEENINYFFHDFYRSPGTIEFYDYKPADIISLIKCPVLAINGDKDIQVVSRVNLPAIEQALDTGLCENYRIIELADHNHFFQVCKTCRISEYEEINYTISDTTLSIIENWIDSL